jgi:hypothetical protein
VRSPVKPVNQTVLNSKTRLLAIITIAFITFSILNLLILTQGANASYSYETQAYLLDIGNPSNENLFNLTGWGPIEPQTHGGNWGGKDDGTIRTVWYNDTANPSDVPTVSSDENWASADFNISENHIASRILIRALDGIADDSFEAYINDILVYSYADEGSTETWKTHKIVITQYSINNILKLKIKSTGSKWSGFDTYGQLGISWIKIYQKELINTTVRLIDSHGLPIANGHVEYYNNGWSAFGTTNEQGNISKMIPKGKYTFRMCYDDACISLRQDIGVNPVVIFSTVEASVKFVDSNSVLVSGGIASYHSGSWKLFGITNDTGFAKRELLPRTYTFKMTYDDASVTLRQDISSDPLVNFSTINITIKLQDSTGNPLDGGVAGYHSGFWKDAGVTNMSGMVNIELLPRTYTFKMTYDNASVSLRQDISSDSIVLFSTVEVTVKLEDSLGNPLADGNASYHAGSWKYFGTTNNTGVTKKELLPRKYTFKIKYDDATISKRQDISSDPLVVFSTVEVTVKLQDSNNNPTENGTVQYHSSSWKLFGETNETGEIKKELLPRKYTFKMTYDNASVSLIQDVGVNPIVEFSTIEVTIKLQDSHGTTISGGIASYHAGSWKHAGITNESGLVTIELLSRKYTFKIEYDNASVNKRQDVSVDPLVVFSTVNVTIRLEDGVGVPLDGGVVGFHSGFWKSAGVTNESGMVNIEILPRKYTFKMAYDDASVTLRQDISSDPLVIFSLINVTIKLINETEEPISNNIIYYYAAGWKQFGITNNSGETRKDLLPRKYTFKAIYNKTKQIKRQNVGEDPIVIIQFGVKENKVPVANAGGPYSGNISEDILFNGSESYDTDGTIVNYTWDFGDNCYSYEIKTVHQYSSIGYYIVNLTVKDDKGATNTNSTYITITKKESTNNEQKPSTEEGPVSSNNGVNSGGGSNIILNNQQDSSEEDDEELETENEETEENIEDISSENQPPTAKAIYSKKTDNDNIISFDASASSDPDGDVLQYRWDFNNDGIWDTEYSNSPISQIEYNKAFEGEAKVEVFDGLNTDETTIYYIFTGCIEEIKQKIDQESTKKHLHPLIEWWWILVISIFIIITILLIIKKRSVIVNKIKSSDVLPKKKNKILYKLVSIIQRFLVL